MPRSEQQHTKTAREFAKKHADMPTQTLAKLIYKHHPTLFDDIEHVRTTLRRVRGNFGQQNRKYVKDKTLMRENGHQSDRVPFPQSKSRQWTKYDMPGRVTLVLSDLHVPYHDEQAIRTLVDFAKREHKIDSLLLNGDFGDMHSISHWERRPDETDLRAELQAMREMLLWLIAEFPDSPVVYKKGNHEEWLDRYYWRKAPELWGIPHCRLETLLGMSDDLEPLDAIRKIEFVEHKRPIKLGKLTAFHGHELPKGLVNAVNPARGMYLRLKKSAIAGHWHQSSSHTEYTWDKEAVGTWSAGCLCCMNPDYAPINKWNLGGAVVEHEPGGAFNVYNYKLLGKDYEVATA